MHIGITGQKGNGIQGIRKGLRDSQMGEHDIWGSTWGKLVKYQGGKQRQTNKKPTEKTWGKTKNRSSENGRFIKWGRIVKREKAGDGNKWDRIFKRDPEAESEEVLKMVAKRAKKERKTTTQICTVVTKRRIV